MAASGFGTTVEALRTGALTTAVLDRGRQLGDAFQDRLGRAGDSWQQFSDEVEERSEGSTNPLQVAAAGVAMLDRRLTRRGQAMRLDGDKRKVIWEPRVAPADQPEQVMTERRDRVRVPRLLTLGYTVQENDDGTLSFWQPPAETQFTGVSGTGQSRTRAASPTSETAQVAAAERRVKLVEAGALVGNLAALRAELTQLRAAAAAAAPPVTAAPPVAAAPQASAASAPAAGQAAKPDGAGAAPPPAADQQEGPTS